MESRQICGCSLNSICYHHWVRWVTGLIQKGISYTAVPISKATQCNVKHQIQQVIFNKVSHTCLVIQYSWICALEMSSPNKIQLVEKVCSEQNKNKSHPAPVQIQLTLKALTTKLYGRAEQQKSRLPKKFNCYEYIQEIFCFSSNILLFQICHYFVLGWQNENGTSTNMNVQLQRGFKNYIHPAH